YTNKSPTKGVYYFSFTGCVGRSGTLDATLVKNSELISEIHDRRGSTGCSSNSVTVQLEVGDTIFIRLWNRHSIFDQGKLSTFTGFLLFVKKTGRQTNRIQKPLVSNTLDDTNWHRTGENTGLKYTRGREDNETQVEQIRAGTGNHTQVEMIRERNIFCSLSAGIFTAPTKGVYYFSFTGCVGRSGTLDATLVKNSELISEIHDRRGSTGCSSNSVTVQLEVGDTIFIRLWNRHSIFDQSKLSTFTGPQTQK
uniref:C1q domain-containing protein n=1 Tax=Sphaeramia orbicularis TaxID=375764 RepID=A0A672YEE6_9TELE